LARKSSALIVLPGFGKAKTDNIELASNKNPQLFVLTLHGITWKMINFAILRQFISTDCNRGSSRYSQKDFNMIRYNEEFKVD